MDGTWRGTVSLRSLAIFSEISGIDMEVSKLSIFIKRVFTDIIGLFR